VDFHELTEARIVLLIGHQSYAIDKHFAPQLVGEAHRRLRGQHAAIQFVYHVIASPRRKGHGRHAQLKIVEQLAKVPDSGRRHLRRHQLVAGIDLNAIGSEAGRRRERLP
jgi:hypothetical protein